MSQGTNEEMVILSGCECVKDAATNTQSGLIQTAGWMTGVQLLCPGETWTMDLSQHTSSTISQ